MYRCVIHLERGDLQTLLFQGHPLADILGQDDGTLRHRSIDIRSGTVEVARTFGQAIACKDVIFAVEGDHGVYTTTVCRNDEGAWTWAEAEPSIHRWGYLQ
jgi:hypothetical protein